MKLAMRAVALVDIAAMVAGTALYFAPFAARHGLDVFGALLIGLGGLAALVAAVLGAILGARSRQVGWVVALAVLLALSLFAPGAAAAIGGVLVARRCPPPPPGATPSCHIGPGLQGLLLLSPALLLLMPALIGVVTLVYSFRAREPAPVAAGSRS